MNIFYFIGASGVGKSAICRELSSEVLEGEYVELDEFYIKYKKIQKDHKLAIEKTKEKLQEIEKLNNNRIYFIDVGSFAQKYLSIDFWEKRKNLLVCLKNTEDFCYDNYIKRPKKRMNIDDWRKSEFGGQRNELYSLAEFSIDCVGLDILTTKKKVLEIIFKTFS